SGEQEVYLLPGYAVDGYGRAVVVINPCRLTTDLMVGQPTGSLPLWLRYDEGPRRGVRRGFETCAANDQYSRIVEGYTLEAGYFAAAIAREGGVSVAGEAVTDAREARRAFDDQGPLMCDGSVPSQDLPRPAKLDRWLIPLGLVGWKAVAGKPGNFTA